MSNHENTESLSLGSTSPLRDKLIAIEAWLFTQQRIRLYGSGAVVAYAISLTVRFFQHRWMFSPRRHAGMRRLIWFLGERHICGLRRAKSRLRLFGILRRPGRSVGCFLHARGRSF